jgi:hypothetical protein
MIPSNFTFILPVDITHNGFGLGLIFGKNCHTKH